MPIINKINNNTLSVNDYMGMYDSVNSKPGIRGQVLVGHDFSIDPVTGRSDLGELICRSDFKDNEVLMGGSIYALEKLFDVNCDVNVDYLNNIMGIGTSGPVLVDKYPRTHKICLWTVGLGGCGDNRKDIKAVYQQQRQLNNIIPFRIVDEPFAEGTPEYEKYYLMRQEPDGRYAYYGKTFAKIPVIVPLWRDSADDKDGSKVVESDYTSTRTTPIEVFAECLCIIEEDDFREYFDLYDNIEDARFNEVGLVSGILSTTEDGRPEYKQALQVSCCHFTNEPLHMDKDMSMIYRWYSV